MQACFLRQDRIVEADIEPAVRHTEIVGVTMLMRSRLPSIAAVDFDRLVHVLSAVHAPVKRDIAQP